LNGTQQLTILEASREAGLEVNTVCVRFCPPKCRATPQFTGC